MRELSLQLASGIDAEGGLVKHTWGTELKLEASGLAEGAAYDVVFVSDGGTEVSAGSMLGTGENTLRCSVNAALPIDDADRVVVTDRAGAVVIAADIPC